MELPCKEVSRGRQRVHSIKQTGLRLVAGGGLICTLSGYVEDPKSVGPGDRY